jgi:hypothetical protein
MTRSIPPRPSLEYHRNEAKDLAKLARAGDSDALARIRRQLPHLFADSESPPAVALHDAQRVVALEHGFSSWPHFKRHIEDLASAELSPEEHLLRAISGETSLPPRGPRYRDQHVRVIEGPFSNFSGRVREVRPENGQVLVMVEVFGRSTPVWLSYEHVEKA